MTTNKPTPLYGPNGTIAYNADGSKAMSSNKPEVQRYTDMGSETSCPLNNMRKSDYGDYILYKDYEALQAECDALRAKTGLSLGVGDGTGNLFVHGDYDSIKRVQELIFKYEKLCKDVDVLVEAITSALYGPLLDDLGNRDEGGLHAYPDLPWIKKTLQDVLTIYRKGEKI